MSEDMFGVDVVAVDLSAKAAIHEIGEIETSEAMETFLEGEGRPVVLNAAYEKFPESAPQVDASPALLANKDAEPMPVPKFDTDLTSPANADEKQYMIEIDEVEGRPNFEVVGVNGVVFKIQRGVPVKIPHSVLEVLNHAVAERIVQSNNPQGGVSSKRQKYTTVPFRVLQAL
jgi:hypothetical protein